jgi:hypothetical protein
MKLLERAKKVIAIELDPRMVRHAAAIAAAPAIIAAASAAVNASAVAVKSVPAAAVCEAAAVSLSAAGSGNGVGRVLRHMHARGHTMRLAEQTQQQ